MLGSKAEIEARLEAGESLTPGQVAILCGNDRQSIVRAITQGLRVPGTTERWYPAYTRSPGGWRRIPSEDVRRIVELCAPRRGPNGQQERPPGSPQSTLDR